MNSLNEIAMRAHQTARDKGFWDGEAASTALKLLHITEEVGEAVQEYRSNNDNQVYLTKNGKPCGLSVELADVIILSLDLLLGLGIDPEWVIKAKMDYNDTRPRMHGGRRF